MSTNTPPSPWEHTTAHPATPGGDGLGATRYHPDPQGDDPVRTQAKSLLPAQSKEEEPDRSGPSSEESASRSGLRFLIQRSWQDEAMSKYNELQARVAYLKHLQLVDHGATRGRLFHDQVTAPLAGAYKLITEKNEPTGRTRPVPGWVLMWWTGASVEAAWRCLRQAERGLLMTVKDEAVVSMATKIRDGAVNAPGVSRAALKRLTDALPDAANPKGDCGALRDAALEVHRLRYDASDRSHQSARRFRNQLLTVTLTLLTLALLLVLGQWLAGFKLFVVPVGSGQLGETWSLLLVMFFGAVGALFSALPSLATQPKSASPFDIAHQQALLKVTTGVWSAVIGVLAVTTGMVTSTEGSGSPTVLASVGALVMMAAIFGAGQEAVTRFADRNAREILEATSPETSTA